MSNHDRIYLVPVLITILIVAGVFMFSSSDQTSDRLFGRGKVTVGDDIVFTVDIASSPESRRQGLSGRSELAEDEGVLFLFDDPGIQPFWMKDMLIPIDVLWIRHGSVVGLEENILPPGPGEEPRTFAPSSEIDMVLEIPAGTVRRLGISSGMPFTHEVDRPEPTR